MVRKGGMTAVFVLDWSYYALHPYGWSMQTLIPKLGECYRDKMRHLFTRTKENNRRFLLEKKDETKIMTDRFGYPARVSAHLQLYA